ncbi:MAG: helix-turn-helix transcriptional regulator [Pseudomonadota bacterium]
MLKSIQVEEPKGNELDEDSVSAFVATVGAKVRHARTQQKISRRELSELSGISERYLAQLEAGESNISVGLLYKVAVSLNKNPDWFLNDTLDENATVLLKQYNAADNAVQEKIRSLLTAYNAAHLKSFRICLIGLRGAGKSTLGRLLSKALQYEFVELNRVIEENAGMPVSELIALYGQEGYRQLEKQAIETLAGKNEKMVLAVGGGIVSENDTFEKVLKSFHTIWLKAKPDEHMQRVLDQGDYRPMQGMENAMVELKSILTDRENKYAKADLVVNTSEKTVEETLEELKKAVENKVLSM